MPMELHTDKQWDMYPHVILTGPEWDPTVGQNYHTNGQMDRPVPLRTQVMNKAHLRSFHSFV